MNKDEVCDDIHRAASIAKETLYCVADTSKRSQKVVEAA